MTRLDNWAICYGPADPYTPPEMREIALIGTVTGHPNSRHYDGKEIRVSRVIKIQGRVVTTRSGTVYTLGDPKPAYRSWLADHRPSWDPDNPLSGMRGALS